MPNRSSEDNAQKILRDIKDQSLDLPLPEPTFSGVKPVQVNDLRAFDGEEFLTQVYRTLLLREPEQTAIDKTLFELNVGLRSKMQVISNIRNSPEGKKRNVPVSGLLPAFLIKIMDSKTMLLLKQFGLRASLKDLTREIEQLKDAQRLSQKKMDQQLVSLKEGWAGTEYFSNKYYSKFEEQFRGSREVMVERFNYYLNHIDFIKQDTGRRCLDLGSGHGVWLDLLRDQKQVAQGVEINQQMIDECNARGHHVTKQDMLEFLKAKEDNTFDLISGFHIIEHVSTDTLTHLVEQAFVVIKPGGYLLFETPNPGTVLTSTYNFYLDPSHHTPIHPLFIEFLFRSVGFVDIEIIRLHPCEGQPEIKDPYLSTLIQGPQDYSILAKKP